MNTKRYYFKSLSVLIALTAFTWIWTACSNDMDIPGANGRSIELYVDVSTSMQTKTIVSENGHVVWTTGDQLLVTDLNGIKKGTLVLKSGEGSQTAQFIGTISGVTNGDPLNFIYLGAQNFSITGTQVTIDLSTQDGSVGHLNRGDIMAKQASVTVSADGKAYVSDLTLNKLLAIGHFSLKLPDGVSAEHGTLTIGGIYNKATVNLANGTLVEPTESGTITLSNLSSTEVYINLAPGECTPKFTFTTQEGKTYGQTLSAKTIPAGAFLTSENGQGIEVNLSEVILPTNPGESDNWGGSVDIPDPTVVSSATKVADTDGWTVNVDNYGNGGFGTKVTYTSNGIVNGLLCSKGTVSYYFQWGRWLGFPSSCGNTHFNSNGSAKGNYPNESQYLPGVNIYDTKLGYVWDSGLVPSYGTCWMGNTDWTRERALNCSIIFGKVSSLSTGPLDYIGANEECTWEERSGNPCPSGYRIPKADELTVLIPTDGAIDGSKAEIKMVNGVRIAMEWVVNTSETIPCVEIRSVPTSNESVSVGDAIFTGANVIRLPAYGYLDNEASLQSRGTVGVYWSSESGTNTISGTSGLGGKYLEIDFNGSKATIGMDVACRSFGACVIPIKDATATATSLTPWLPLSGL